MSEGTGAEPAVSEADLIAARAQIAQMVEAQASHPGTPPSLPDSPGKPKKRDKRIAALAAAVGVVVLCILAVSRGRDGELPPYGEVRAMMEEHGYFPATSLDDAGKTTVDGRSMIEVKYQRKAGGYARVFLDVDKEKVLEIELVGINRSGKSNTDLIQGTRDESNIYNGLNQPQEFCGRFFPELSSMLHQQYKLSQAFDASDKKMEGWLVNFQYHDGFEFKCVHNNHQYGDGWTQYYSIRKDKDARFR